MNSMLIFFVIPDDKSEFRAVMKFKVAVKIYKWRAFIGVRGGSDKLVCLSNNLPLIWAQEAENQVVGLLK